MKSFKLSIITVVMLGNLGYAGGEFSTVTPYEVEDEVMAEEVYVEPEPAPEPEPVAVAPKPEPKPVVVLKPAIVSKAPVKNIKANGFYAGLGITDLKYEDHVCKGCLNVKYKDTTYGIVGRAGYDFNQYIGIEVRGSKTNWDSQGSKVKHIGAFIKPMIPLGDNTNAYGLIGYGKTDVRNDHIPHVHEEGLALGAGIEVDLSKDTPKDGKYARDFDGHGDQEKGIGIFIDYERMQMKKDSKNNLDVVSVGLTYDF